MDSHSANELERWCVDAVWIFREKEYIISGSVKKGALTVEVEERLTADRWQSHFESKRRSQL